MMHIPKELLPNVGGIIDYVVPLGVVVEDDGALYASVGEHIHGIRDRAGLSLVVYDGEKCPVCEAILGPLYLDTPSPKRKRN